MDDSVLQDSLSLAATYVPVVRSVIVSQGLELSMLKPIPTPHPVIAFGSLLLLSGLIWYSLHHFEEPQPWIGLPVVILVFVLCTWSRDERAKKIQKLTRTR